jgi:hypothetical protein
MLSFFCLLFYGTAADSGVNWLLGGALDLMEVLGVWDYTRQARDVVKAVKKRLANKSPTVQLLALTVSASLQYSGF